MLQYTPGKFPGVFLEKIVKFYRYKKCSTCVKALKYLEEKGVALDIIEIREEPPLLDELKLALDTADGNIKALLTHLEWTIDKWVSKINYLICLMKR